MKIKTLVFLILLLVVVLIGSNNNDKINNTELVTSKKFSPSKFYSSNCASCHLADGSGKAGFSPKLKGQHWQYLKSQMLDIQNGRRTNGLSYVMKPIFSKLNDVEKEQLAKYLQKLK